MAAATVTRPVTHIARRIGPARQPAEPPVRFEVADLLARIEAAMRQPAD